MNNYCVSKSLFIIKDLKMTNIIIIIKSISCVLFLLLHVIIKNISMATKVMLSKTEHTIMCGQLGAVTSISLEKLFKVCMIILSSHRPLLH